MKTYLLLAVAALLFAALPSCRTLPYDTEVPGPTIKVITDNKGKSFTVHEVDVRGKVVHTYTTKAFSENFSPPFISFTDSQGVARKLTGSYDVFLNPQ